MRAAPAVRIDFLQPTPALRALGALLVALAAAAFGGWLALSLRGAPVMAAMIAAVLAALAATLVVRATPGRPAALGWDARRWTLAMAGADALEGELAVAMDLGGMLLLRFEPEPAAHPVRWIALRRAEHAAQWHALRCAVYSPRPAAEPGAAATDGAAADPHDRS